MPRGRTGPGTTDERLVKRLPQLWALGIEVDDICERFGATSETVYNVARRLGLAPRMRPRMYEPDKHDSIKERRRRHGARVGNLHHRAAIRQPDPVVLLPSPTLFGAPLKALDEETRALIDSAVRGR